MRLRDSDPGAWNRVVVEYHVIDAGWTWHHKLGAVVIFTANQLHPQAVINISKICNGINLSTQINTSTPKKKKSLQPRSRNALQLSPQQRNRRPQTPTQLRLIHLLRHPHLAPRLKLVPQPQQRMHKRQIEAILWTPLQLLHRRRVVTPVL